MRLYINECIKAFCRRSTIGIFLALTVLNGVLLWVNESLGEEQLYTARQYKAVYDHIQNTSADKALEKLTQMQSELEIIEQMSFGEEVSDIDINADTKSMLEKYKSKSYLRFCNDIYTEPQLIADVIKEVQAFAEYDSYLDGIDKQARKMTGISLFAEPDSFSYKNIAKTPDDFAHLKGSTLAPAPSKGAHMATGFFPTDIAAFLMIMTVVVTIVTRENELDQITLSRTTYKGRIPLGIAKLMTCFTAAFAALILLYSVNLAAGYFTYGYGDLGRQIQSVFSFNGSDLKLSVIQYFVLFLISKFGVYCLFAALIYMITTVSNSSVKVYALLAVILAAEAVMYFTTVIYILTYAPYFYNVLNAYGTRQLSAPAYSLEHLSGWNLSILEYLILISVLRYLGMILAMLLIYFVSRKAKSYISAILIETAVLIVPPVLFLLDLSAFKWFGLSPIIFANV